MERIKYIEFDGEIWRLSGNYYRRHITIFLHRYVWEKHFGTIPEGFHIHHKDGNKLNNDISNLECLTASDHHRKTWEENYEKMCIITKANLNPYHRTDEQRKTQSERSKKYWKDNAPTKVKCKNCNKYFSTKQPKLAKQCRLCQKDSHYKDNHEKRICEICSKNFNVYKYSKTTTCSNFCKKKKELKTRGFK